MTYTGLELNKDSCGKFEIKGGESEVSAHSYRTPLIYRTPQIYRNSLRSARSSRTFSSARRARSTVRRTRRACASRATTSPRSTSTSTSTTIPCELVTVEMGRRLITVEMGTFRYFNVAIEGPKDKVECK